MVLWTGGNARLATLLYNRGVRAKEDIESLLQPLAQPEPDLGNYGPLLAASARIKESLAKGEKIAIYGDYDVDGISATTLLTTALARLGGNVVWHIPDRFSEGYGMDSQRVRTMAADGVKLIITCDCGISNAAEIRLATELGIAVVVTDHHLPPKKLPPAAAILNFKLLPVGHPSRDLPGVGTAFVLARFLLAERGLDADDLLDLVALGIIADVVPVLGHSRQLYLRGLTLLKKAQRPGIAALFAVAKLKPELVDEEKLGFQVAPRINAAGRLANGGIGVELLLAEAPGRAQALAQELNRLNLKRKELSGEILAELKETAGPVVAFNDHWHQGVIGIAAGQIANRLGAPVVLMTRSGESIVGSARSPAGIDIHQALSGCKDYLLKYGGHAAAAGFSLTEAALAGFVHKLKEILNAELAGWRPPALTVDLMAAAKDVTVGLVEELAALSPCGEGNPPPILYSEELKVKSVRPAGPGHIITLGDQKHSFAAGIWDGGRPPEQGSLIGAAYTVARDHFRGQQAVMATVKAWQPRRRRRPDPVALDYVDLRGASWRILYEDYSSGAFYREGAQWLERPGSTRTNLEPASTLVLLTPPPAPSVLRQILAVANPRQVVLGFSFSGGDFMPELLGALKYVFRQGGNASLTLLAAALAQTEETVLAALQLLAESKIISYELLNGQVVLAQGQGAAIAKGPGRQRFEALLAESVAFKKWLCQVNLADIQGISP